MKDLAMRIEVRDYDLDRIGVSLSVLGDDRSTEVSKAYLRMNPLELNAFVEALKVANGKVELSSNRPKSR